MGIGIDGQYPAWQRQRLRHRPGRSRRLLVVTLEDGPVYFGPGPLSVALPCTLLITMRRSANDPLRSLAPWLQVSAVQQLLLPRLALDLLLIIQ